jgi:hypothetical protein
LKREQLSRSSTHLPPLAIGDNVAIQDASNLGKPGKWTKTGLVTDCLPFQSYEIKVDGSNSLTKRNRVHLRKIIPFISQSMLDEQRFLSTPTPATTRSASSTSPPSSLVSPSPPSCPTPSVSSGSSSPPTPSPEPSIEDITMDTSIHPEPAALTSPEENCPHQLKPKPHLKERWIVANSNPPATAPTNPSLGSGSPTPPLPGQKHDYAALAERAKELRDSIMKARTSNLTT